MGSEDIVLEKMRELKVPLTLEKYIAFSFLGDPPEGIEDDGEFLASVPDVILKGWRRA
jgi:hypothetical protein